MEIRETQAQKVSVVKTGQLEPGDRQDPLDPLEQLEMLVVMVTLEQLERKVQKVIEVAMVQMDERASKAPLDLQAHRVTQDIRGPQDTLYRVVLRRDQDLDCTPAVRKNHMMNQMINQSTTNSPRA